MGKSRINHLFFCSYLSEAGSFVGLQRIVLFLPRYAQSQVQQAANDQLRIVANTYNLDSPDARRQIRVVLDRMIHRSVSVANGGAARLLYPDACGEILTSTMPNSSRIEASGVDR